MTGPVPQPHGGNLAAAVETYGTPDDGWLDLSTGINPVSYPVAPIATETWQRLPDRDDVDALADAMRRHFGAPTSATVTPLAGSQAAIQSLPRLRAPCRVAVIGPTYNEHAHCWRVAGHDVEVVSWDAQAADADVVVVVNPNNPDGRIVTPDKLLQRAADLAPRGGWLVVDEAFADADPTISLGDAAGRPGLVILRSAGKFFGLAGLRLGAVLCTADMADALTRTLGPWSVSGPALAVGRQAYTDHAWIAATRKRLTTGMTTLDAVLARHGLDIVGGTALFRLIDANTVGGAQALHERLATQGIWTRVFDYEPAWMRLGLPGDDAALARLDAALVEACAASRTTARAT